MNERGQYGLPQGSSTTESPDRPWTRSENRAFQRSIAVSAIGSVAGAVLWKDHRVWGFILGGMAGGAVGNLAFSPPTQFTGMRARSW